MKAGSINLNLIIHWLYFALLESSEKQGTLGKMALGLRVTTLRGNRISFAKATGRHFARLLSVFSFGLGFLMMAFNPQSQSLHDKLAGTLVFSSNNAE